MTMPKRFSYIPLSEINAHIIRPLRKIDTSSDSYRILENGIIKDGQRHPITLRKLTKAEQAQADAGQIYGIIDGHHRYQVALDTHKDEILADVVDVSDQSKDDIFRDLKLAVRLNESSTKMTDIEKGNIIYDMMQQTGKDAPHIAMEIFGVKTSMAYRCLNAYKKSIGETVVTKPRKPIVFDRERLITACRDLSHHNNNPQNVDECIACLQDILSLERELRRYKQLLLDKDGVRVEFDKRKTEGALVF